MSFLPRHAHKEFPRLTLLTWNRFFSGCAPKAFVVYGWLCCAAALLALFLGALLPSYIDHALTKGIKDGILITPAARDADSQAWRTFISSRDKDATKTYMRVHMLNLTNPEEVLAGAKPILNEVGPYVYVKESTSYNVTFMTDRQTGLNVVEYRDLTEYEFNRELTPAALSETDVITTQNTVFQIWRVVASNILVKDTFAKLWNDTNTIGDEMNDMNRMFTKRPVSELLFGYHDPRFALPTLSLSADASAADVAEANEAVAKLTDAGMNADAFFPGFMGPRETEKETLASTTNWMSFFVGDDVESMAFQYNLYNNATHIQKKGLDGKYGPTWGTLEASRVLGTDGRNFRPFEAVTEESELPVFVSNAHRSVILTCSGRTTYKGLDLLEFRLAAKALLNSTAEPPNAAWNQNGPSGMFDLSPFNIAPMVLTKPHFLDVSPAVAERVDGLAPDRDVHDTVLMVEPISGSVMKATKSLQMAVNTIGPLKVEGLKDKPTWFAAMPTEVYVPSVWMQEAGEIGDSQASDFADAVYGARKIRSAALPAGLAIGTIAALAASAFFTAAYSRATKLAAGSVAIPASINSDNNNDYSAF
mgnify:CR=1 FL=1